MCVHINAALKMKIQYLKPNIKQKNTKRNQHGYERVIKRQTSKYVEFGIHCGLRIRILLFGVD